MTYEKTAEHGPGLRLHLNENTSGCSPAVLAAIRAITPDEIAVYPDYGAATADCARWFGVPDSWVQLINGLDEGLHFAAQWARLRTNSVTSPAFEAIVV